MKKLALSIMAAFVLLLVVPPQLRAENEPTPAAVTAPVAVASKDASVLVARVEAIKAMDFSTLSSAEKKELRKELRTIKSDLKENSKSDANSNSTAVTNGGIYLSVGAIIIIILLLILLL
jgi:hypothetical protein